MIKPEQVPKEAMEAAAVQLSNGKTTAEAIAAAINAWPMAKTETREVLNFGNNIDGPIVSAKRFPFLILPLMEKRDDE